MLSPERGSRSDALRCKLEPLLDAAQRHSAPFDTLHYESHLDRYRKYPVVRELADVDARRVEEGLIAHKKRVVLKRPLSEREEQSVRVLEGIESRVEQYLRETYRPIHLGPCAISNPDAQQCIITAVQEQLVGWNRRRTGRKVGSNLLFYRPVEDTSTNLLLAFYLGHKHRGRVTPAIGVDDPYFLAELGSFFGKTHGRFNTEEECKECISEILELLRAFLPEFQQVVHSALVD